MNELMKSKPYEFTTANHTFAAMKVFAVVKPKFVATKVFVAAKTMFVSTNRCGNRTHLNFGPSMAHVLKTINRGFQDKMRVCNFRGGSHSEGFR